MWTRFATAIGWVLGGVLTSFVAYWVLDRAPGFFRATLRFVFGVLLPKLLRLVGLNGAAAGSERLAERWYLGLRGAERTTKPYLYILPAYFAITVFLLYPAVITVYNSFRDKLSQESVGWKNYVWLWEANTFRSTLFNTLLWIIIVPAASVVVGLVIATLADRLTKRWENVSKSVIFMPMAVSLVGAATMWKYIYGFDPKGQTQTGILNAIVTGFGADPVPWDQQTQFHLNSLLLMVILLWSQAGFSMVLLSAAIKGVPEDTIEAGRIDGASPRQSFFRIVLPQIRGTIVTLLVTGAIGVMKVFDVVYVTTNGRFNTDVIGRLFWQMFSGPNYGRSSAIVVVLLIAVIPIMIFQIRHFRREEGLA